MNKTEDSTRIMKKLVLHPLSSAPLCRYFIGIAILFIVMILLSPTPAEASGFLKVTPLKYEEQLQLGSEKTGYVDVSNSSDRTVTITTQVQAFRQVTIDGDLEFYDDEQIQSAIEVDVDEFELGPREAARIFFAIDSNQLPEGGVYAAVFFRSGTPEAELEETSQISTTSRVGTLLLLENGQGGIKRGKFSQLDLPFWQLGNGINGYTEFTGSDRERSLAFTPELQTDIPIAGRQPVESGLVFAGHSRGFDIDRSGNYIGIFPVTVTDEVSGQQIRQWVVAVTGVWRLIVPLFIVALTISYLLQRYFKRH